MKISVNGEIVDCAVKTLADLLTSLGQGQAKVATAVNELYVPSYARADLSLEAGDRVEIVAPRQGG